MNSHWVVIGHGIKGRIVGRATTWEAAVAMHRLLGGLGYWIQERAGE